jgi:hypothetical protein
VGRAHPERGRRDAIRTRGWVLRGVSHRLHDRDAARSELEDAGPNEWGIGRFLRALVTERFDQRVIPGYWQFGALLTAAECYKALRAVGGGSMEIRNQGQGVHAREIHGLGQLRHLPREWYAYTNLEVSVGPGQYREIDAVLVTDDRVLLVDLKDWKHRITCGEGRWYHGNLDMGSPVAKIRFVAHKVLEAFRAHLREHNENHGGEGAKLRAPLIQGVVVQCGPASLDEIVNNEKSSAFMLDDFMRFIVAADTRASFLGPPQHVDRRNPLTAAGSPWRSFFATFFNASDGPFRPGKRRYGPYRALSDKPTFVHQAAAYQEFDVEDENVSASTGLLRRWDFSQLDTRFQTETGRNEIAGRERKVIAYLNDRNPNIGAMILQPKVDDGERSVGYWEVFETRRRLKRLADFAATVARHLAKLERLELVRQFLAKVKAIHDQDTAHLDIGYHSVWIEPPNLVRLSHLLAARISVSSERMPSTPTKLPPG